MQRANSVRSTAPGASSFNVPERYQFLKMLGSGSYGVVASFHDTGRQRDVAVKRVKNVWDNFLVLRRTLREVRLMRHFRHPNVLRLHKALPLESSCGDLYLSIELMDCDLENLLKAKTVSISASQARSFCAQMMLGLLALHSGHVIHRDLKPANIFVRLQDGKVKIGDLGLSRGIAVDGETGEAAHPSDEHLTEYVVTRWYRAPEVLLNRSKYGPPVDVWSVGCILYEMWGGKTLFPGKNSYDQLKRIIQVTGVPTKEQTDWVPPESMPLLERTCAGSAGTCANGAYGGSSQRAGGLAAIVAPKVGEEAADFLERTCTFDPRKRFDVDQALHHGYLRGFWHAEERALAKSVTPADVAYDRMFDGVRKDGEAVALVQLGRLLRYEANRDSRPVAPREPQQAQRGASVSAVAPEPASAAAPTPRHQGSSTSASEMGSASLAVAARGAPAAARPPPFCSSSERSGHQAMSYYDRAAAAAAVATAAGRTPQTDDRSAASGSTPVPSSARPQTASAQMDDVMLTSRPPTSSARHGSSPAARGAPPPSSTRNVSPASRAAALVAAMSAGAPTRRRLGFEENSPGYPHTHVPSSAAAPPPPPPEPTKPVPSSEDCRTAAAPQQRRAPHTATTIDNTASPLRQRVAAGGSRVPTARAAWPEKASLYEQAREWKSSRAGGESQAAADAAALQTHRPNPLLSEKQPAVEGPVMPRHNPLLPERAPEVTVECAAMPSTTRPLADRPALSLRWTRTEDTESTRAPSSASQLSSGSARVSPRAEQPRSHVSSVPRTRPRDLQSPEVLCAALDEASQPVDVRASLEMRRLQLHGLPTADEGRSPHGHRGYIPIGGHADKLRGWRGVSTGRDASPRHTAASPRHAMPAEPSHANFYQKSRDELDFAAAESRAVEQASLAQGGRASAHQLPGASGAWSTADQRAARPPPATSSSATIPRHSASPCSRKAPEALTQTSSLGSRSAEPSPVPSHAWTPPPAEGEIDFLRLRWAPAATGREPAPDVSDAGHRWRGLSNRGTSPTVPVAAGVPAGRAF